jgi:hypothetical protein
MSEVPPEPQTSEQTTRKEKRPRSVARVVPEQPQLSQEIRDELTAVMQELLVKTHELSFEFSTMECPTIASCPLAQKAKELFRTVKQLNQLMRQVTPVQPQQSKPSYTS